MTSGYKGVRGRGYNKSAEQRRQMGFDVIVIARGGGSIEDLFIFNDEKLARAIFNAKHHYFGRGARN